MNKLSELYSCYSLMYQAILDTGLQPSPVRQLFPLAAQCSITANVRRSPVSLCAGTGSSLDFLD